MKSVINQKGFTLIELIIVIAILGILAAIMTPQVVSFIERAKLAADQTTVRTLNSVTAVYRVNNSSTDPFINDSKTNTELMEVLVSNGYLTSIVEPRSIEALFAWIIDEERWYLLFEDSFYVIGLGDGLTIHGLGMLGAWNGSEEYSGSSRDIILPSMLNDIIVKRIGSNTFRNKGLLAVAFEKGSQIEHIHARAFYKNNLSHIDFPETLERIDLWSFRDNNLTEIELPESLHTIEQRAFDGNALNRIIIGSNVTKIEDRALGEDTDSFKQAYEAGGAGTYVWNGVVWVKQGE